VTTNDWLGTINNDFNTAGNWQLNQVPTSSQDAVISTPTADTVTADAAENVGSISVGSKNILDIANVDDFTTNAFSFTVVGTTDGSSGVSTINGTIDVTRGVLYFGNGQLQGSGVLELDAANNSAPAALDISGSVLANGTGSIEMATGGATDNDILGFGANPSFTNVSETISGTGIIGGGGLAFINDSNIDTNNSTSSTAGVLEITGSAEAGSFTNNENVIANNGGTLIFGIDGDNATIGNNSEIGLDGEGSTTTLKIAGNVTIGTVASSSPGDIDLGGNFDSLDDQIVSDGHTASLTLVNQQLKGAGLVGDANLTLTNESLIEANDSRQNHALLLSTGNNTIINSAGAVMEANDGELIVVSSVNNAGTIAAIDGTVLLGNGPEGVNITGAGAIDIGQDSFLQLDGTASGNLTFTGDDATLNLLGSIGGEIVGASVSDSIDFAPFSMSNSLRWVQTSGDGGVLSLVSSSGAIIESVRLAGSFVTSDFSISVSGEAGTQINIVATTPADSIDDTQVSFAPGEHAVWQQTSGSGGTVSLFNNGVGLASFNLTGQFNSLDFAVSNDGAGGSLITFQATPSFPENPGNNDEWILSDGSWVESAGPGSHPAGYNVALTGDWTGSGTDGILWFNPTTGDADEWQLSNTQWSGSVDLGSHPTNATDGANYQIAGTDASTDFTGNGIDDVLWTSPNSDGTIATDIWELSSSGQWLASVSPGSHPAGYTVAGTGDWTGSGTDGILWFNSSTGDTDEWQLSGGNWAASVDLGSHPTNSTDGAGYQIAGIGDFTDNGIDDVLWTSVNSDGTIATDIWELNSSGQWMASVSPGNHPAGYSVVGVGDFTGTGTSDILWYNASTGDTDEWLINNGQWAGSIDLGTHPGSYQIAGVGDFNGAGNAGVLWHSSS
jgi:hypothetical protein